MGSHRAYQDLNQVSDHYKPHFEADDDWGAPTLDL